MARKTNIPIDKPGGVGALLISSGREHYGLLALRLTLGVLELLSQMVNPWLMKYLIDSVILPRQLSRLPLILGALLGSAMITVIIRIFQRIVITHLATQISSRVRLRIVDHVKRIPLQLINTRRSGELLALSSSDVPVMISFYEDVLISGALNVIRFVAVLGLIVIWFDKLAWIALASLPLYIAIPVLLSKRLHTTSERVQHQAAALSAEMHESIASTRDIRVYGREQWDLHRLREALACYAGLQMTLSRWTSLGSVSFALYWVVCGAVYLIGGREIAAGTLTLGSLLAAISYIAYLNAPVSSLVELNAQWHSVLAAARRIAAFLDIPVEQAACTGDRIIESCVRDIVFDGVSLEYSPGLRVLHDVSLRVAAGRRTAIVGQSGSGKTSIIGLLLRLYQPVRGRILIDGVDISEARIDSLRRCVGVAFQDSFLFGGSIAENVRLGNPAARDEEIVQALEAVGAMDWIATLPAGIHTALGERGAVLSGGQRQRVVLARIFVSQPSVLVLDEATSMLDAESEQAIFAALTHHLPKATVVIVAHRLSAVLAAESVIVLHQGKFVASGSHDALMRICPTYRQLIAQQLSYSEIEVPLDDAQVPSAV